MSVNGNNTLPAIDTPDPSAGETEKYIGLILAISSSLLIGTSFILTKRGLMDASRGSGKDSGTQRVAKAGESYNYLRSYMWWAGMITMILGEAANFAAYSFAPAILVTPLGAGSVVISAILSSFFLNEYLTMEGKIGCALCILGSIVIILHSPEEVSISSTEEVLSYALKPGFIVYMVIVASVSLFLIYRVAPVYGKKHMLVYITICSLVGSVSVMACKGFGIAIKLTIAGQNQFIFFSTYIFAVTVVGCAVTQINYFNKALDLFSTNRVTPVYYVMFTTTTILASIILFEGIKRATVIQILTALCGFITIFIGVFMVNSSKSNLSNEKTGSRNSLSLLSQEIALKPLVQSSLMRSMDPNTLSEEEDDEEHEENQRLQAMA